MKRRRFHGLAGAATLAYPLTVLAQTRTAKIAIAIPAGPTDNLHETANDPNWPAFFAELRRLGRVEGSNLVVERYSAGGATERHASLAREVVARNPDVIFAVSNTMARNFGEATAAIPIVTMTTDPISLGLTASLSRPSGNTTGVITDAGIAVWEKRFELLRTIVPEISRAAFLVSRYSWEGSYGHAVREIAPRFGISIFAAMLESPIVDAEYRRAFAALQKENVTALLVNESAENFGNRQLIVELANTSRLPTVYPYRDYASIGGLVAYATDIKELMRQAATQIEKILNGAKPSDVPYYQATKFELVINLRTAKALGITIQPTLLARADEVIE